jgi:hypothetical protein
MAKKLNPSRKSVESGKETKLQVGRPRSYMPDELQQAIENYFQYCLNYTEQQATAKGDVVDVSKPRIPTMGGLMNFLDMDRITWHRYGEEKQYSNIIKKTDNKIREAKEEALVNGQGSTTGLIFYLKAKEGWVDKQTVQHEGEITVTLNLD